MDNLNEIHNSKLKKIVKDGDLVTLEFVNMRLHKKFRISFNGLLFETTASVMNETVETISTGSTLGFKAITELRRKNKNLKHYTQLYVKMSTSTEEVKKELIGACHGFKLSKCTIKK